MALSGGLTSLSEAWNRFIRRRIWIDPHHCWEIGDGHVTRTQVETALRAAGLATERFAELPYCDYWSAPGCAGRCMNILLVSYYFPPMGGAGVQRALKFSKYLGDFGVRPRCWPRSTRLSAG